jgi:penicillin-binding protein 1B
VRFARSWAGRDYQVSQYNRAVLARRQPGSAFKPFVYMAALRPHGGPPPLTAASIVEDAPISLTVGDTIWTPRNYGDRYEGRVTVRRALELSLNAATVRVAEKVGLPAVIETARTLGLDSPLAEVPAIVLGAFETTPLELARAYLPFANGGPAAGQRRRGSRRPRSRRAHRSGRHGAAGGRAHAP